MCIIMNVSLSMTLTVMINMGSWIEHNLIIYVDQHLIKIYESKKKKWAECVQCVSNKIG